MTPVDQTLFRGDGEHGNCVPACIASILDLPLAEVPHFAAVHGPYFMQHMREWFENQGMGVCYIDADGRDPIPYPHGVFSIATGKSPRGEFLHSVVWRGRKIYHDPHPSRAGIVGGPKEFMIIAARGGALLDIERPSASVTAHVEGK